MVQLQRRPCPSLSPCEPKRVSPTEKYTVAKIPSSFNKPSNWTELYAHMTWQLISKSGMTEEILFKKFSSSIDCPHLESVKSNDCTSITDESVIVLYERCRNLIYIPQSMISRFNNIIYHRIHCAVPERYKTYQSFSILARTRTCSSMCMFFFILRKYEVDTTVPPYAPPTHHPQGCTLHV